jgi:hypothetical protein
VISWPYSSAGGYVQYHVYMLYDVCILVKYVLACGTFCCGLLGILTDRWEDNDKVNIKGLGCKSMNCSNLSQDGDRRAAVSMVVNLQAKCW